ncbi:protein-disulfide reductase DsbD family protein [Streptacidiphilus jiangxiensis]|uniref:Disulphide bond corrector protein DsbC n=1 Tax=Streptacidiphilus jiangxiensis TaxID=235985 RepID=A0A1H7TR00_STRJI|nr:protein-disulfide reductase DsbD family protein [Streptacidiphilus jiangxiensis]SEL86786.1 hypothetical protein SAMN05414137_114131 [Streptacidiphilus jiangxiensis]
MRFHRLAPVLALALAGCAGPASPSASRAESVTGAPHPVLASPRAGVDLGGVHVVVALQGSRLAVTLTPDRPGFHLYSAALPDGGVDGLGVPTRLRVRHGLTATGALTASVPVRTLHLAALGVDLPVYPDGPVTLTLPVERTAGATGAAEAVVSFGACSADQCLAPVRDQVLPVPQG